MCGWLPYLQPAATLIVGGLAVLIASRQFTVNRNKLRIDLYPKRYELYEKVTRYMAQAGQTVPDRQIRGAFKEAVAQSRYLFDQDLHDYLHGIWVRGLAMARAHKKAGGTHPPPDGYQLSYETFIAEHKALFDEVQGKFAKYLDLTDIGANRPRSIFETIKPCSSRAS